MLLGTALYHRSAPKQSSVQWDTAMNSAEMSKNGAGYFLFGSATDSKISTDLTRRFMGATRMVWFISSAFADAEGSEGSAPNLEYDGLSLARFALYKSWKGVRALFAARRPPISENIDDAKNISDPD